MDLAQGGAYVLSAGFGQYSEADRNVLMDRMKRHLEDLEDARGSEVFLDPDVEVDPPLLCGQRFCNENG